MRRWIRLKSNKNIVRSGLRIPYDLNTWLIKEAERIGVTKNALILQILWDWTEQKTPAEKQA